MLLQYKCQKLKISKKKRILLIIFTIIKIKVQQLFVFGLLLIYYKKFIFNCFFIFIFYLKIFLVF